MSCDIDEERRAHTLYARFIVTVSRVLSSLPLSVKAITRFSSIPARLVEPNIQISVRKYPDFDTNRFLTKEWTGQHGSPIAQSQPLMPFACQPSDRTDQPLP